MFPLYDENPTVRRAYAVVLIIATNALVWVFVQGLGEERALAESLCRFGLVPGDLLGHIAPGTRVRVSETLACRFDASPDPFTLLSSMFMHGGWFHIAGNLWFLWVFGDNVEDAMGPLRFGVFYVLCGLAAAAAQILSNPASPVPMVGASGAIGGVMGAYALLYPRAHVHTLIFLGFYITTVAVPAFVMLGYWFALQVIGGLPAIGSASGGVAFWAHVGGFVAGVVLVHLFTRRDYLRQHLAQRPRRRSRHRW